MKKILRTAAEIARMGLPGLPTTKANVINRAEKEQWYFEEAKGPGGTRRLYEIPAKYLSAEGTGNVGDNAIRDQQTSGNKIVGSIAAGARDVDWEKMDLAMRALDEWEQERGVRVVPERRAAVISVLYDYLVRGEADELTRVFKAIG